MEHRYGQRRRISVAVRVRRRGWGGAYAGQLRDISVSGAFVKVPAAAFPKLGTVDLEFRLAGERRVIHQRAMVVRHSENGIGIMFDDGGIPALPGAVMSLGRRSGLPVPAAR